MKEQCGSNQIALLAPDLIRDLLCESCGISVLAKPSGQQRRCLFR